ncbi:hypothetical protein KAJ27_05470 [bacterium]|nr:hypothetical protein [bacterium]
MSMRINNNIYSLTAYRHLSETQGKLSTSIERLSSGFRINTAADDAAGLAISEKLRSQISGYEIAAQNAQDGISIVQTADGALDRTHTILRRMRDLTELAANGDKTDADRAHYQEEVNQLLDEIDRIGKTTEYNTKKLLDGSIGSQANEIGDIDSINVESKIKVVSTPQLDGEYKIEVKNEASKAKATFTAGADDVDVTVDDTFSTFMGAANDGTYTFRFAMDGKETAVDLISKASAGDTITEVVEKINMALSDAGMEAHAKFHADVDTDDAGATVLAAIEIEADNFGSAHDISFTVVNQPKSVYNGDNFLEDGAGSSYNALEGTAGAIYNSDRSGENGLIHEDTVFTPAATVTENDLQALTSLTGQIEFTNKNDVTATLTIAAGDKISDIVSDIDGFTGLQAIYNGREGRIEVFSTGTGSDPIVIEGTGDSTSNNQLAAMLGLYGTHYGSSVVGERLTSTTDYHLEITAPNDSSTVDVFAKFGNRNTKFDAVKSDSAVIESQVDPDQLGSEEPGAGGISGIEFTLEEKTLSGTEKFSIMVSRGELELQVGANDGADNRMKVAIDKMDTGVLNMSGMDVSTQANAQNVLDSGVIDTAIESISTTRAKLGAMQNRLNHTIANLSITKENLASAESRIRDTDFAKETMEFTKHQIMAQAGTSMLQQANMMPQLVLSLLG